MKEKRELKASPHLSYREMCGSTSSSGRRCPSSTSALASASDLLNQVYNYKKPKDLPLKGGKTLNVKMGLPCTFYKVRFEGHTWTECRPGASILGWI